MPAKTKRKAMATYNRRQLARPPQPGARPGVEVGHFRERLSSSMAYRREEIVPDPCHRHAESGLPQRGKLIYRLAGA